MYNKNEIAILYLDTIGLSPKKCQEIISELGSPENIFISRGQKILSKYLDQVYVDYLKSNTYEKIENKLLKPLEKYDIFAVTIVSSGYPEILKNIADPPIVLYTRGDSSLLSKQKIGVVGTRKISSYGKDVTAKFSKELVSAGLVTVSGLSYGVDTVCAKASLEEKGKTIAVLAGGLDSIYPADNVSLSEKIIKEGGLLVSEYRPGVRPKQYSFLARNRIISGLCDGVLVVEAGLKSGSMSTANFAIEQNRELFVVPGNINSPQSAGTNDLINQIPDCFTISVNQILDRLHVAHVESKKDTKNLQLDFLSSEVVELLKQGELHFDEICQKLSVEASQLASTLTMLEIMGIINKNAGNYYSLAL